MAYCRLGGYDAKLGDAETDVPDFPDFPDFPELGDALLDEPQRFFHTPTSVFSSRSWRSSPFTSVVARETTRTSLFKSSLRIL